MKYMNNKGSIELAMDTIIIVILVLMVLVVVAVFVSGGSTELTKKLRTVEDAALGTVGVGGDLICPTGNYDNADCDGECFSTCTCAQVSGTNTWKCT